MSTSPLIKVFLGMVLGLIAGSYMGEGFTFFSIPAIEIYDLIGTLFLNALTLVVVPLVAASIITGTSRLGSEDGFEKIGKKTLFYFFITGILAVGVGFFLTSLFSPGSGVGNALQENSLIIESPIRGVFPQIKEIFYRLIPQNIFAAAAEGQLLGVILFSALFGLLSTKIPSGSSQLMSQFWTGFFEIMMRMTHLVMKTLPIGVFGLIAKVIATTGFTALKPVLFFFLVVLLGLFLFSFVIIPFLLYIKGISPIVHFKRITPALVTAFTTSSSAATIPISIECLEKDRAVSNKVASFVLPLGTSINLTGTALYVTSAVIFIAQSYALPLDLGQLSTLLFLALFSAFGLVAGIPSASIVTIILILQTLGLPKEAIGLILPVERILDMFRTVTSVITHTACAALVDRR